MTSRFCRSPPFLVTSRRRRLRVVRRAQQVKVEKPPAGRRLPNWTAGYRSIEPGEPRCSAASEESRRCEDQRTLQCCRCSIKILETRLTLHLIIPPADKPPGLALQFRRGPSWPAGLGRGSYDRTSRKDQSVYRVNRAVSSTRFGAVAGEARLTNPGVIARKC